MRNLNLPLEGRCRCDRVRIRVTQGPLMTTACHCRGCRRMASSAFSLTAIFPASGFEVTQGEPVVGGAHGDQAHHMFCAYCMTWMFTRAVAFKEIVNVRPTMLDDHAWFRPFMETYTEAKLSWAVTGAVRSFSEFPSLEQYGELLKDFRERA